MPNPRKTEDPAGMLEYIESHCAYDGPHYCYSGEARLQVGFKYHPPARAYWLLTRGLLPADKPFLINTCGHPNCIEPNHWEPSRSPHGVMRNKVTPEDIAERLDKLQASQDAMSSKLQAILELLQ